MRNSFAASAALAGVLVLAAPAQAKVEGDTIILGSAISLTGKYSQEGKNAKVLVVSGHTKGATTAARQISEMNVQVPLVAMTHCESADLVGKFGKAAEGILCPTQWAETLSYRGKAFGSAGQYDKLFRKTYSEYETVPYHAAQASAAVVVWKDAFERAQSFDTERLRDAIAATDLQTFYGPIKFGPQGNNIAKPMVLRQIQDGEYNVVAPAKWASHKLEHHAAR